MSGLEIACLQRCVAQAGIDRVDCAPYVSFYAGLCVPASLRQNLRAASDCWCSLRQQRSRAAMLTGKSRFQLPVSRVGRGGTVSKAACPAAPDTFRICIARRAVRRWLRRQGHRALAGTNGGCRVAGARSASAQRAIWRERPVAAGKGGARPRRRPERSRRPDSGHRLHCAFGNQPTVIIVGDPARDKPSSGNQRHW